MIQEAMILQSAPCWSPISEDACYDSIWKADVVYVGDGNGAAWCGVWHTPPPGNVANAF